MLNTRSLPTIGFQYDLYVVVGQYLTSMYKALGSSPQIKSTATKKPKLGESLEKVYQKDFHFIP